MNQLFRIDTDRMTLEWGVARTKAPALTLANEAVPGCLVIRSRRNSLVFGDHTWRSAVPQSVANDPTQSAGPHIFEQTDYPIFIKSRSDKPITVRHRDPLLLREIRASESGTTQYGIINFGSQVGRSEFSLLIGGEPEIDFEIEVFPTKLDYSQDYDLLTAEVQEILTGLVVEYLRATFKLGGESYVPRPTYVEWVTLLNHVFDNLTKALLNIARQPLRAVARVPEQTRCDRARKIDNQIRRQVLRGNGGGGIVPLVGGLRTREKLQVTVGRPTLDTPEHRWLVAQLKQIARRLVALKESEQLLPATPRRKITVNELSVLEGKLMELLKLEPFRSVEGQAPPGFASLQLLSAPGYREAFKCCLILKLGLRLTGGPVRLSVKDVSVLYEYWCYLAILKMLGEVTGRPLPANELLVVEQDGLRVLLQKGKEKTVPFELPSGRRIKVAYNPRFRNEPLLVAQQPDFVVSIFDSQWPVARLVIDAKYRIDTTSEYVERYRCCGPPEDAINVLHRYRDAILDSERAPIAPLAIKRTVIQGVALFPYRERSPSEFRMSRLWQAVDKLGIGAIPALPGEVHYLREWVEQTLRAGGWRIADKAIAHRSHEAALDWKSAASEPVLIGVLRGDNEKEHWDWVTSGNRYYVPATKQPRQYATKYIALYMPATLRKPGAITHWARVRSLDVVKRSEISTPWRSARDQIPQVLYELESFMLLDKPVENRRRTGPTRPWWTSRLGLLRASDLQELQLETEPEWRLYEELKAAGVSFALSADRPRVPDPADPIGRARFIINDSQIQYRGAAGFCLRTPAGADRYFSNPTEVILSL